MIVIRDGRILTMEGAVYECGSLLIEGGKIRAVGEDVRVPDGARVIDAKGCYVLPGFVDAHTHLGLAGTAMRWEGADHNEVYEPVTPHLRSIDAINPFDPSFRETLEFGVTCVATSPGSANVIGGQLAAMKTGGSNRVEGLVIRAPLAMKCALGENPKWAYGQSKKISPLTRMGTAAIFREAFFKAREYMEKREGADNGKAPEFNMKHEAIIPLLKREIPVHIHAHRADDIHTAIRLIREFNLRGALIHCTDGHLIADDVLESGLPALVGPTMGYKSKPEVANKSFETINILHKAGVKVCITTDHPVIPLQHLNVCAALSVQAGMDEAEALKAISIYPAEILNLHERVGSIKTGKDADIVIWNKNPIDITSHVLHTIIDGKVVYSRKTGDFALKF